MNTRELNYAADVKLDPDALDVEWIRQPELARQYGDLVVRLRGKVSRRELQIKEKEASLVTEAQENPSKVFGKEKYTVKEMEAYIRNHPEFQQLERELLAEKEELAYSEVAKNEITYTRKAALENLVVLHGQKYFAGPVVPRNLREEMENREQVNAGIAESLESRGTRYTRVEEDKK